MYKMDNNPVLHVADAVPRRNGESIIIDQFQFLIEHGHEMTARARREQYDTLTIFYNSIIRNRSDDLQFCAIVSNYMTLATEVMNRLG